MHIVTRQMLEAREHEMLSHDAMFSDATRGRERHEEPDPLRTCFQQDRDRILHSKSFRRLANKTQVFLAPEGDHYRTRLTHTLEVAQVAGAIVRALGLNADLAEAVALGHDLGHTPFGHAGERALREARAHYREIEVGSREANDLFRHNEQSVRVLRLLEKNGRGLNLTFEVLDGIVCHTGNARAVTLEGRAVARADRIAYVVHDIDDAERAGLICESDLPEEAREVLGSSSTERIETMIHDIVRMSELEGDIAMSDRVWRAFSQMRHFLYENLYATGDARSEEPKAEHVVKTLFVHFLSHMDEVPDEFKLHDDAPDVQVADYVSTMTDRYAIRLYEEMNVPRVWGVSR